MPARNARPAQGSRQRALIFGVTGQDGSLLARLLIDQGAEVYGAARSYSEQAAWRLRELDIVADVKPLVADIGSPTQVMEAFATSQPDMVFSLAAQSSVSASFSEPARSLSTDPSAVVVMLETMRQRHPSARFYQASSSEMFGRPAIEPQDERTPFRPMSPYAIGKVAAHSTVALYREAYGLHASCGILFNHESPWRGAEFVTRKITKSVVAISGGSQEPLRLGNLNARRDWGFAADYVRGIVAMIRLDKPDDFVFATGRTHSVRDFVDAAFRECDREVVWSGFNESEEGRCRRTGQLLVTIDARFYRPAEPAGLVGDASKAHSVLEWKARLQFDQIVALMVRADRARHAGEFGAIAELVPWRS